MLLLLYTILVQLYNCPVNDILITDKIIMALVSSVYNCTTGSICTCKRSHFLVDSRQSAVAAAVGSRRRQVSRKRLKQNGLILAR